ncbi:Fur family transcriptional regulator [Undibacterium pigrum]|uniref:Fe2+ or Zn2+ uptake regulation protein n=1 Tax=Undibacterium pigrum TaxID=401470 RepID=A0A318JD73_9BURK|nr:transcriptional repressor [Undibacterium pigrum]PXX46871.1 Fe2+ or Zn2+ uptake regulation protein [Undibacterium pigrum]
MNSDETPRLAEQLQRAGLRPTVGRIGMLAAIMQIGEGYHYPEDILRELLRQGRLGSITTIYRVLADLTAINFLQRSFDADGKAKYRLTHASKSADEICLVCEQSGRRITVQDRELRSQLDHLARVHGMETSSLPLLIQVNVVSQLESAEYQKMTEAQSKK